MHAERSGSLRYAKGESQTMGTLKGLRERGVKVELGIPEDLWDAPSAEITNRFEKLPYVFWLFSLKINKSQLRSYFLNIFIYILENQDIKLINYL